MAIHYIPTEYTPRKQPENFGYYFSQQLMPLIQAMYQQKLNQDAWKERQKIESETTRKEKIEERQYGLGKEGWKPSTETFMEGEPEPDMVVGGKAYTAPKVADPRIMDAGDGGKVMLYGGKAQYVAPSKATNIEQKMNLLVAARGGSTKVTPKDLERLALGDITYDIIQETDAKGEIKPGGAQQYHIRGEDIPKGWKVVKTPAAQVNITQEKPASPQERTAIASGRASIDSLNNLKDLYDKAFVGPVAGRAGKVKDVFGLNVQKQSEFYAATAAFKNQVIKEITGAQMSEVEARRIMKQVPDVDDPPTVWAAKWSQSKKNLATLQRRRLEVLEQSGLRVPQSEKPDPLGIR